MWGVKGAEKYEIEHLKKKKVEIERIAEFAESNHISANYNFFFKSYPRVIGACRGLTSFKFLCICV